MIWLVGCKGMLGTELSSRLDASGLPWKGTDKDVDMRSIDALRSYASRDPLDWIINCAAYTAVEKAEDDVELATALNVTGAGNLATVAKANGAKMLHISTDYVFDGYGKRPYLEDDPVAPIGVYGRTKAEGEALVRANCPESFIVRTAWLYGEYGNNFVHTMLRLMAKGDGVGVVADQRGSPTYAGDLADAIVTIVRSGKPCYGTYHFTDEGETTWYDFALAIRDEALAAGKLEKTCAVNPLTTAQYPTKVRRPGYSVLSKAKISSSFGIRPPEWRDSLAKYVRERYSAGT